MSMVMHVQRTSTHPTPTYTSCAAWCLCVKAGHPLGCSATNGIRHWQTGQSVTSCKNMDEG